MNWLTKFLDSFRKPPPGVKKVGKLYQYHLNFQPGNATVSDRLSIEAVKQAVWRAKLIPQHRIEIVTHEDPADSQEAGMAARRLEALRNSFLADSIPEGRIEVHVHAGNCCAATPGEFARRAEIRLFPLVASLREGPGEAPLSYKEVSLLQLARAAVFSHHDQRLDELSGGSGQIDWTRVVGYTSLREWASAGARHPLYDEL